MIKLSPDMFDAVTEVFNIGVGSAAQSLRLMLGKPVKVGLPHVEIIDQKEVEAEFSVSDERFFVGTTSSFEGGFGGEAMLLLSSQAAIRLSQAVLERSGLADEDLRTQEVVEEVSNVMVVACFSKIADLLDVRLSSTAPTYLAGMDDIRARFRSQLSDDIVWFRFRFAIDEFDINGYIYFLMDPVHSFLKSVENLMERVMDSGRNGDAN